MKAQPSFVALDRDGTLISHVHHLRCIEDVELVPNASSAIRRLNESDIPVVIVTNQSVIGRGLLDWRGLSVIHDHICQLLAVTGAHLDGIYICPHVPEAGCICRKPEPGLLLRAASALGCALNSGVMIGDHSTDIRTAIACGMSSIHVRSGVEDKPDPGLQVPSVPSLVDAVNLILEGSPAKNPKI